MYDNPVIDLAKLSDRALIALAEGLRMRWEIEVTEARNAFFPENSDTTAGDLDLHDVLMEELYARGNGGHRYCRNHLLPLTHPDGCERCEAIATYQAIATYRAQDNAALDALNNNNEEN